MVLALALLAGAGCGGDDNEDDGGSADAPPTTTAPAPAPGASRSDEDAIRATMTTYLKAVADGDGKTACAQLTESGRRVAARAPGSKANSCEELINGIAQLFKEEDRQRLRDVEAGEIKVRITGDSATADVPGGETTAKLVREGDRWLIDEYDASDNGSEQDEDGPDPPAPRSVSWDRVEEELDEVMERRYDTASYECPPRASMRAGDAVECTLEADGKRGTMRVTFQEGAYLGYQIRLGGRISYGQSQITP